MATKKKQPPPPPPPECAALMPRAPGPVCVLALGHDGPCDDGSVGKAKGIAQFLERENDRNRRRVLETVRVLRAAADDIERAANGEITTTMVPSSLRNISFPIADAIEALAHLEIRAQTASFFKD